MALDKVVDSTQLDSDLTSVANAIRAKGGTSADLAFPAEFVDAIDAIETGGGGPTVNDLASGSWPTGDIVVTESTVTDNAFYGKSRITSVELPNATTVRAGAFQNCSGCTRIHAPVAQQVFTAWQGTKPSVLCFPAITSTGSSSMNFSVNGNTLHTVDIGPGFGSQIRGQDFRYNSGMTVVVLRSNTMRALANVSAFQNTPFASGGAGGTLYVPQALISSYQAATNWSTILGYANNNIQAIEGSAYENAYADGTPIS